MAIVDRETPNPDQPRHLLNHEPMMRDVNPFGGDPDVDLLADQATGNRVGIAPDLDRTAGANTNTENYVVGVEFAGRQWTQPLLLAGKRFLAFSIATGDHAVNELHVVLATGEVTTAANHQCLVDGVLEMAVGRFDVAVLIGASGVRLFGDGPVVVHQGGVTLGQLLAGGVVVDRGAEAVGSMTLRNPAELPERFLDPLAEGLERLRETERYRLDVGVSQHAVKQHVIEPRLGDRYVELIHDREVTRGDLAGLMHLWEHHRFAGALGASPKSHTSLEGPSGRVGKLPGKSPLKPTKEGLRLESRFGFEPLLDLRPDIFEGIDPGAVFASHRLPLRGETLVVSIASCGLLVHHGDPC